jgi:hypothetical protein
MKRHTPSPRRSRAGVTFPECLVYVGALITIATIAFSSLNRLWAVTGRMAGVADDLRDASRAGEQWRADVRAAVAPIQPEDEGRSCVIQTGAGTVTWFTEVGALWRRTGDLEPSCWVRRIHSCQFSPSPRQQVAALQLDLELVPRSRQPRHPPAFTFLAVPGPGTLTP